MIRSESRLGGPASETATDHSPFLLALDDSLRDLAAPGDVLAETASILGQRLGCSRVGYAQIDWDAGILAVERDWTDGSVPSISGRHQLMDFGEGVIASHARGETYVLEDVRSDPRIEDARKPLFLALGLVAAITVPLVREGRLVGLLSAHEGTPRRWTDEEVSLVVQVARRTWAAFEHAQALARLQESERNNAFQLGLADRLRRLADPASPLHEAAQLLCGHLGADHCEFVEAANEAVAGECRTAAPSAPSALVVPVVNDGKIVARLTAQRDRPRTWREAEVRLAEDVAARTWDMFARARAEADQRESRALLAAIMENAPIGIYLKDAQGRYIVANAEMAKLFAQPVERIIGSTAADLLGEDYAQPIAEIDRKVLATGRTISVEEHLPGAERYEWTLVIRFPVASGSGAPPRIGGFDIDITPQKCAEADLEQSRLALQQSEKLSAMGSLLAGVAHELNNPLSILLAHAELMQDEAAGSPFAEDAATIRRAAERCSRIVQTFLAMARQKPSQRAAVDLNQVVESVLELTAYAMRTTGIEISLDLAGGLPAVHADPDQIHQVVANLVINAQQALEQVQEPRRLTLRTGATGRQVILDVSDNGPGVPPEVERRMYEPFFTTKEPGTGTGIGLSFALGILEAHGGGLELIDGRPGRTCFRITLAAQEEETEGVQDRIPAPMPEREMRGSALVVDDEPELASILARLLRNEGYEVTTAASGGHARTILEQRDFDVIFSDLRMPGLDGPGLFAWIEEKRPHLRGRVAFVTGDTLGPRAHGFLTRAGCPFLDKPFTKNSIREVLAGLGHAH